MIKTREKIARSIGDVKAEKLGLVILIRLTGRPSMEFQGNLTPIVDAGLVVGDLFGFRKRRILASFGMLLSDCQAIIFRYIQEQPERYLKES